MSESLRGRFLVAAKGMRDPNFYRTVVLMVEHGDAGAMGLVVNRPSSITVGHALSGHFDLPETDDVVFVGGPVEPAALFILHNAGHMDAGEPSVLPGLFVGSSADVFEHVVRAVAEGDPDARFRIFCGCAGWGPGQLEGELDRGDWYQQKGGAECLFDYDPYEAWDALVRRVGEASSFIPAPAMHTEHPEWN